MRDFDFLFFLLFSSPAVFDLRGESPFFSFLLLSKLIDSPPSFLEIILGEFFHWVGGTVFLPLYGFTKLCVACTIRMRSNVCMNFDVANSDLV